MFHELLRGTVAGLFGVLLDAPPEIGVKLDGFCHVSRLRVLSFRAEGYAEFFEDGHGEVFQARIGHGWLAVGDQDAGNRFGRNTMIADPGVIVRLDDFRWGVSQRGGPGCAVAGRVADDQVGLETIAGAGQRVTFWIAGFSA